MSALVSSTQVLVRSNSSLTSLFLPRQSVTDPRCLSQPLHNVFQSHVDKVPPVRSELERTGRRQIWCHAEDDQVRIRGKQLAANTWFTLIFLCENDGIGIRPTGLLQYLHRSTAIADHFHIVLFVQEPSNGTGDHDRVIGYEHPNLVHWFAP